MKVNGTENSVKIIWSFFILFPFFCLSVCLSLHTQIGYDFKNTSELNFLFVACYVTLYVTLVVGWLVCRLVCQSVCQCQVCFSLSWLSDWLWQAQIPFFLFFLSLYFMFLCSCLFFSLFCFFWFFYIISISFLSTIRWIYKRLRDV